MGPFATWEYFGKTSASVPAQRRVKDHVEREVNHSYKGKSHTSPNEEKDIMKLQLTILFRVSILGRYQSPPQWLITLFIVIQPSLSHIPSGGYASHYVENELLCW
ncbi:hypothetical protein C8Q78DRAFT_1154033 [Trametes maxima]|nr:hypothetical protein C8Q78DRAFT_1154033 [Trametes maxima]